MWFVFDENDCWTGNSLWWCWCWCLLGLLLLDDEADGLNCGNRIEFGLDLCWLVGIDVMGIFDCGWLDEFR